MAVYAIGDVQGCADELRRTPRAAGLRRDPRPALVRRRPRQSRPGLARDAAPGAGRSATRRSSCSATTTCTCWRIARGGAAWRRPTTALRADPRSARRRASCSTGCSRGRCCTTMRNSASRCSTPACRRNGTSPRRDPVRAKSSGDCAASSAGRCSRTCTATSPRSGATNSRAGTGCASRSMRSRACASAMSPTVACASNSRGRPPRRRRNRDPGSGFPWRRSAGERLIFGHWSALGYVEESGVLGLDTGCVWGGTLTGQRIDAGPSAPLQVREPLRRVAAGRLKFARRAPRR